MKRPRHCQPGKRAEAAALDASGVPKAPPADGIAIAGSLSLARLKSWCLGLLLVAGILFAYQPAWHGGFIWDDESHVVHNPHLYEPDGLKRIWFSLEAPQYYPLVFTTFRLERALWGLNPTGYHFVNLLLHTASALLVWQLLRRLNVRGAWLAAAVFALHPVNVESVAWITERKNTLSMFFFLLSLLWYLRFDRQTSAVEGQGEATSNAQPSMLGPRLCYGLALFAFVLALLSKTAVAPLPVVFLLLAWWRRGRVEGWDVWRTIPFFMAALALIPLTVLFEHQAGSEIVRSDPFLSRLAGAGWAFWFYLYKTVLPLNLIFVYPRWRIDPANMLSYVPGLLVVLGFVVCWRNRQGWGKAGLFGLGYFLVMLSPTLGFVNIYFMRYTLVSDHWLYFAIIGPIALAVAALTRALGLLGSREIFLRPVVGRALLLTLAVLTWRQSANYTDMETLWRTTIAQNPTCWMAHHNLGVLLNDRGLVDEGLAHFQKALESQPDFAESHIGVANVLRGKGQLDESLIHARQALELRPDLVESHTALAAALLRKGAVDEAIFHLQWAAQMRPGSADIQNALGNAFIQEGRVAEARTHFQRALQLRPNFTEAHNNLGLVLLQAGQLEEATIHFQQALTFQPTNAPAHSHLGQVLLQEGHVHEAIDHYQAALAIQPDDAYTLNNLAWVLATYPEASARDGTRAVEFAQRADQLSGGNNPSILGTLAAAYAEAGKFAEAVSTSRRALTLASAQTNHAQTAALQARIALYQSGSPFRDAHP
jgi:tetratricopeptide (TPR) repeat protein